MNTAPDALIRLDGVTKTFGSTTALNNASLQVNGGARIICPTCTDGAGVTIVLTGAPNQVGTIDINGGATASLRAPSDPQDPDFRGVLFYRDARATGGGTQVTINGGADLDLQGGLYFPSSAVKYAGGGNAEGCTVLVAATIELTGNATAGVNGCSASATAVAHTRIARLIE